MQKKIGIITWHYFLNFGSALQAYALKTIIEELGYHATILNYRNPAHGLPSYLKDTFRVWVSRMFQRKGFLLGRHIIYPFLRFHCDYLKLGKAFNTLEQLSRKALGYDAIVCGSDQIWAPNHLNDVYLLSPINDSIKKISYAASIGFNDIPSDLIHTYEDALRRFHRVSVREEVGQSILQRRCNIRSSIVLDPTLMLTSAFWRNIERMPSELGISNHKPYIFCYFLKDNHHYAASVTKYAGGAELFPIGYSLNKDDNTWLTNLKDKIGPREFLWLIDNAEMVVTDSYHCTIFAMLFHKQFTTFQRFDSMDPQCQNSRIQQLIHYFDIERKIVNATDDISEDILDYNLWDKRLSILRQRSIAFINEALQS